MTIKLVPGIAVLPCSRCTAVTICRLLESFTNPTTAMSFSLNNDLKRFLSPQKTSNNQRLV